MVIKVECGWCHKTMGTTFWETFDPQLPHVTHSICAKCFNLFTEDLDGEVNELEGKY